VEKRYLSASDCEALTGTPASTFRYWAWADEDKPADEKVGPPSCKLGRRRVWERVGFESWLAKQEAKASA
jgi:prophage regulatory protein